MQLFSRLKSIMKPVQIKETSEYYIPAPDYGNQPVPLSVWRLGRKKPPQDFWGNHGRLYNQQVLTAQGPLMFAQKVVPTAGLGGTSIPFGQAYTLPVAGFAGRPAVINDLSTAAEYAANNATTPSGRYISS